MIEIRNKYIPFKGYKMMTVYPFLFIRTSKKEADIVPEYMINHEKIHARQQLYTILIGVIIMMILNTFTEIEWYKTIVIPHSMFYIFYVINWLWNILTGSKKPYRDIMFEREAYDNQYNLDYLKNSTLFNAFKYLKKENRSK